MEELSPYSGAREYFLSQKMEERIQKWKNDEKLKKLFTNIRSAVEDLAEYTLKQMLEDILPCGEKRELSVFHVVVHTAQTCERIKELFEDDFHRATMADHLCEKLGLTKEVKRCQEKK